MTGRTSNPLPRPPAWPGLLPQAPRFVPAAPDIADRLLPALGGRGRLFARADDGAGVEGFYRFDPEPPAPPLFVKVLPTSQVEGQVRADRLAVYVQARGVGASVLAAGFPRNLDDDWSLLAYPYRPARFARTDGADLAALGAALGKLHQALRSHPDPEPVRQASAQRTRLLDALARDVTDTHTDDARLRTLRHLLHQTPPHYACDYTATQIIHGDLNHGNVLFADDDATPLFLDFEDCCLSWHPPLVDLAMAIERFVLVPLQDDEQALRGAQALLKAYAHQSAPPPSPPGTLAGVVRTLAVRSLCLLAGLEKSARPAQGSEWEKFFYLHEQATRRAALLAEIERGLPA